MLKIEDLAVSKELDSKAMKSVVGGLSLPLFTDKSVTSYNKVADINQMFDFKFDQRNVGEEINNQMIDNRNGLIGADVSQTMRQGNAMSVYDIGNTDIR